MNFPLFIEKADKLSLEILHHLQHYSSIGMVNLWIYIILERQMCEFTILFSTFFFKWEGKKTRKLSSRDLKLFSGGMYRIFIKYCFKEP